MAEGFAWAEVVVADKTGAGTTVKAVLTSVKKILQAKLIATGCRPCAKRPIICPQS